MLEKIKKFFEFSSKNGLYLFSAYDATREEPSATLLAFHVGLILSIGSLISYHFLPDKLVGPVSATLMFFGMTFVMYRMRNLDKVKLDLDDRSIELEDEHSESEKDKK